MKYSKIFLSIMLAVAVYTTSSYLTANGNISLKNAKLPPAAKTVIINNTEWSVENLNVVTFQNGDSIPQAKTALEWEVAGEEHKPVWCYLHNDPKNEKLYGKLYNWYAVADPRGLSPKGWHIPNDIEWGQLSEHLGGDVIAGRKMKSNFGWANDGNGTNDTGFWGLPGGGRDGAGSFDKFDTNCFWWSASESSLGYAWARGLTSFSDALEKGYLNKKGGAYVRCLRN